MAWLKFSVLIFLIYFSQSTESASILALFSSLSYSDHLVFRGFVSRLSQNGHSVVVMTPYPGHYNLDDAEKIVELDVGQESGLFWEEFKKLSTNVDDYHSNLRDTNEFSLKLAISQLKSKQMTALFINPNIKFDLVITEADVPLLYAVAEKYNAPHIAITTSSGKIHQHESKGNPIHPLFYLDVNTLNYKNLTRWQKLIEFKRHLQTRYEYYHNYLPLSEIAAKKIFNLKRPLQEVEYDIDLLFVTANPLLVGNRPTVPAVVYTDRLHITPGYKLPDDLENVLNSASKGAVYFSIGALQEPEHLAPQLLQTIVDTFRELPYKVLWKIENVTAINIPDNVIALPWFQQQEVLAHPNVKVFITSGGPRSLEEALFYEVPIVGLPLVKSRKVFISELTKHGAGEIIDPYYLNIGEFKAIISEVASNDSYKKAMTKLKSITVDPMISGPDDAVWWTNYLLRHGGGRHLRSTVVGVSFFSYYMLDLLTYILTGGLIVLYISFIILRIIYKRIRARILGRNLDLGGKFKSL